MSFLATAGIFNTKPTGGGSVTPTFLAGAATSSTTASGSDTVTIDMSSHNGTDDVLLMIGAMGAAGMSIGDITLDGNADTALVSQANVSNDGPLCAYARIAGTSFAASSNCVVTYADGLGKDCGVAAYAIPTTCTITQLVSQTETSRSGSTLSGNVSEGDGVVAAQQQTNGSASTWTGPTEDYEVDMRSNEWLSVASAGNVSAATPMTITVTGSTTGTAGLSVKLEPA